MRFGLLFCSCLLSCSAIVLARPLLRAQAPAQSSSSSSPSTPATPAQVRKPSSGAASKLDSGTVSAGAYKNRALGFTGKIPAGWVLRTEEMNEREEENADRGKAATNTVNAGRVLLAAFSRPPEARAEDVNSSILIAAESAASYPGLKDAAQYFGPVTEVAKAQGLEVKEEPYEFALGTRTVVRGDFQKNVGTRVMRQSTLAMLTHGYVVSFTFIGGTEDEVEELVQGLSFAAGGKAVK
jgi:hypothetical protein